MSVEAMNEIIAPSLVLSPDGLFVDFDTQLLSGGHRVRFRAPGRSMYPTIRDGEAITVEPVAPTSVRKGDIILYRLEQGVIAHRVARIERHEGGNLCFTLRNDAGGSCDAPVAAQQILGRVVCVEREGRSLSLYAGSVKMRRTVHAFVSSLKSLLRRAFF